MCDDALDQAIRQLDKQQMLELLAGTSLAGEDEAEFSGKYQAQMEALADRYAAGLVRQQPLPSQKRRKPLRRLAVVVAAFFLSAVALAATANAFGFQFLNAIWNHKTGHVTFSIDNAVEDELLYEGVIPYEWDDIYLPTYMIEGYSIVMDETKKGDFFYKVTFTNGTNKLVYRQLDLEKTVTGVDIQDASVEREKIGALEGYLFQKDDRCQVSWQNDQYYFELIGYEEKEEMLRVARSFVSR